ncbi:type I DNA topoisomerase [Maridesulfovibrio salexigens]|uniref:DNA topoisomerase 1 n=1 Tax=Maridesulfovibrio salexigens (strain ATCC 14822 / DSM 2638 / NCIMB 8403 / VKM B-1763) TaxID=526222 RepID=C6BUQ9_MARSD|nr:type I DNA topoisomerase [Maridesulfovibrio salexigens]ACS81853.1 DNA topoisomerase I [Maridesulfovibrio salexigens DSM 2638]
MSKDLIVVESPAKVKTISKFLGRNYQVAASVGHVRDLPKNKLGVEENGDFTPQYQVIPGKEDVVNKLKKAAAKADHVFLAPDPDREGEAIGWHVAAIIKEVNENVSRIQFNEITARAVKEALEHPQPLNEQLFDSQQARRILDRLVGYKISPILWKKVKRGISAGRVQSVALKLVVEREKARRAFIPEEYWLFKAHVEGKNPPPFIADLWKVDGKKAEIGSADEAEALQSNVKGVPFEITDLTEKERKRNPLPPYITSTLQQDANRRLGYSAKRTMTLAQRLYEGVELGDKGTTALITYMRTDSVRIANEARDTAKKVILDKYGDEFYPAKPQVYKSKGGAQDAHEAIRPVDASILPEDVKPYLPADQFKVYKLIWNRFIASQMAPARFWDTVVTIQAKNTIWRSKGERLLFPGFMRVTGKTGDEKLIELPKLEKGEVLKVDKIESEQKFTQPPARYSEASLVRELEEKGIGRPSTYASIISTIQDRGYVNLEEKKFIPTELGFVVSDQLSEHFKELMDVGFTAAMEKQLDDVADGKIEWTSLMKDFVDGFYPTLETAAKEMKRGGEDTGITCDKCESPMVIKFGRTGEFLGCSNYPECKNIVNFTRDEKGKIVVLEEEPPEETGVTCEKCGSAMAIKRSNRGEFLGCTGYPDCRNIKNFERDDEGKIKVVETPTAQIVGKCPDCDDGDLIIKHARTGSRFIACSNYPDCKHAKPFSTGVKCPREGCKGELVEKSSRRGKLFYSCDQYPDCDYAVWYPPIDGPCPKCGHPVLVKKTTRAKGEHIACPEKGCGYVQGEEES